MSYSTNAWQSCLKCVVVVCVDRRFKAIASLSNRLPLFVLDTVLRFVVVRWFYYILEIECNLTLKDVYHKTSFQSQPPFPVAMAIKLITNNLAFHGWWMIEIFVRILGLTKLIFSQGHFFVWDLSNWPWSFNIFTDWHLRKGSWTDKSF